MPGIRRIISGVSGSPRNLPAVRYAAAEARGHAATLILVLAWAPPGGESLDRRFPSDLRGEWEQSAWQRLHDAIDIALGGVPAGVRAELAVVRGAAGPVLVHAAGRAGDLLVIGTGRRGTAGRLTGGRVSHYCVARAGCPVVAVPPARLELEAAHGLHRWAFRRHGLKLSELPVGR
jgi:nucleotide-binding universal stress UspA family protein